MIHHLAVAVKDVERSHDFYTRAMGFKLVKVVKGVAPDKKGWGRHLFYEMNGGTLFALWDLHLETPRDEEWKGGLSIGAGLPWWVNHVAFECDDREALDEKRQRWLAYGLKVRELDHDFIHSIYAFDPDKTLVEWCYRTRELNADDEAEAHRLLADATPPDTVETWEPQVYLPVDASASPIT